MAHTCWYGEFQKKYFLTINTTTSTIEWIEEKGMNIPQRALDEQDTTFMNLLRRSHAENTKYNLERLWIFCNSHTRPKKQGI